MQQSARENNVTPSVDAFRLASSRLAQLLEDAAWDSGEALRAELASYTPAMKLTLLTNCGSLIALIALGLSWASGEDPFGGLRCTEDSLNAAWTGLVAATPLAVASILSRTRGVRSMLPVLEDLHATQAAILQPLVKGLNPSQLLIAASSMVLPGLLLLLPAMHGLAMLAADLAKPEVIVPAIAQTSDAAVAAPPTVVGLDLSANAMADAAALQAALADTAVQAADVMDAFPELAPYLVGSEQVWVSAAQAEVTGEATAHATWAAASHVSTSTSAASAGAASVPSIPLSAPLLLPRGAPDVLLMVRDWGAHAYVDPRAAHLANAVGTEFCGLLPAILSGFLAAYTVMRQLAPRRSQIWAIRDALAASDRYFRLTVSMTLNNASVAARNAARSLGAPARGAPDTDAQPAAPGSSAETPTDVSSRAVSDAFRTLALLWLLMRRRVCQTAYMLIALHSMFASLLWQHTGDLAAPAACCLLCVVTELWLSQWEAERTAMRGADSRNGAGEASRE